MKGKMAYSIHKAMREPPRLLDTVTLLNDVPVKRLTLIEPDYASIQVLPSGLMIAG